MGDVAVGIVGAVVGVVGAILGIIGAYNYAKKTTTEETTCNTRMIDKLDYLKTGIDTIQLDNKDMSRQMININNRLIVVEESTKSAHKRLDKFEDLKQGE